jgi:serine/threonine protein kinase
VVDQYLGSGTFSHVVKVAIEGSANVFVKIPKSYRMKKSLEREAEALKALHEDDGRGEHVGMHHVPELYDAANAIKILHMKIRCESSTIPCLPLKGLIGQPSSHRLKWDSADVKTIFDGVYAALKFANGKNWAHLDVRPSNIITSFNPSGQCSGVMLIDWGCAHRTDSTVRGFVGCLPFAHNELFGLKRKWKPRLDHDLASLVYSMIRLLQGCITWSGFSSHRPVTVEARNFRFEMTSDVLSPLLQTWKLSSVTKGEIFNAIGNRERRKRKPKTMWTTPLKRRAIDGSDALDHTPVQIKT